MTKLLLILALVASATLIIPVSAHAAASNCAQQITSMTRGENEADNELNAKDYVNAYIDYQKTVEYRANCVDETSGKAQQWNLYYEAADDFAFGAAAMNTEAWKDQGPDLIARAHSIANDLLSTGILPGGPDRSLVTQLFTDTTPSS